MRAGAIRPDVFLACLLAAFMAGALAVWSLSPPCACGQADAPDAELAPLPENTRSNPRANFQPVLFSDIPGWKGDDLGRALAAFKASCRRTSTTPDRFAAEPAFGTPAEWSAICRQALDTPLKQARPFFEAVFEPALVLDGKASTGHITGYYEPELEASRRWSVVFSTPVYPLPPDLVIVDPAAFADRVGEERMSGKVVGNRLVRYETRAEIETAAYAARVRPLVYMRSPVDAFFLQIQGSGRVKLDGEGDIRLGYAGQNGHPYTPIGAILVRRGEIPRELMSMQAIRAWLAAHPHEADDLMNANASYVFFQERAMDDPDQGPEGAEGVALTPGRSLAVDKRVYPYGLPIFVRGQIGTGRGKAHETMSRLMIAQDTGGAIRGVVRGDVFFGWGPEAEARAGATDGEAQFYVLRPRRMVLAPAQP